MSQKMMKTPEFILLLVAALIVIGVSIYTLFSINKTLILSSSLLVIIACAVFFHKIVKTDK